MILLTSTIRKSHFLSFQANISFKTKFKDILKNKEEIKKIQKRIDDDFKELVKLEKAFPLK